MDDVSEFDLGTLDYQDESTLEIVKPGTAEKTGWVWTFHGPSAPQSIAATDRVDKLMKQQAMDQSKAMREGREWSDPRSFDERRDFTVTNLVMRVKSFTQIKLNGEMVEFSPARAKELLLDRKKGWLLDQVSSFLLKDASFIARSAQN